MASKQHGFSDYQLTTAKKQSKREKFLAEMEAVVPLPALIALIEPHYPRPARKAAGLRTHSPRRYGSICCSSGIRSVIRPWRRP
jgi:hypothetical protein